MYTTDQLRLFTKKKNNNKNVIACVLCVRQCTDV